MTYNAEDCVALKKVTEFIQAISEAAQRRSEGMTDAPQGIPIAWADEVAPSSRHQWGRPRFVLQDFDHVNRCAYFDYQRDKVFIRTNAAVRQACLRQRRRKKRAKPPPNQEVEITSDSCPFCKGGRIIRAYSSEASWERSISTG